MFADDSNIFMEGNKILTMQNELNMEMIKMSSWLKANKLSLNINRTHFMLFKGKGKIKDEINIKIDHTQIKQTQCTKFLGVQIDDKITWKNHIMYISRKVARGFGILWKIRRVLDKEALRNLYFSFIYPYLTYCVHVWGNSAKTYLAHLQKLQKKIVRVITFSIFNSHTQPLTCELKLLNIEKIHLFTVGIFMFKYINGEPPDAFDSMFSYRHEIYYYNTRGANQLHMEQFPTNLGLKGMRYYGAKLWNDIFLNFTDINSIHSRYGLKICYWIITCWKKKWFLVLDDEKCITVSRFEIITIWRDYQNIKSFNSTRILLTMHLFTLSSKMFIRT